MSDSVADSPKKPAAARKKPTPRVNNPLENLHLKSSKRGSIKPPERYALEPETTAPRKRKAAPVKKTPTSTKKKSTTKKATTTKKQTKVKKPAASNKTKANKPNTVNNNLSPAVAVAASS